MEITGVKVYFDGEKFVADDAPSAVHATSTDSPTHWIDTKVHAETAVEESNKHLKVAETDMVDDNDFVVKKCKDCGEYYVFSKPEYDWYKEKNFVAPRRCNSCRTKRRMEAKAKNAVTAETAV